MGGLTAVRSTVKSVQRGVIAFSGSVSSMTATISAVDTSKSRVKLLGFTTSNASFVPIHLSVRLSLTDATTVTATRQGTGSSADNLPTVAYEVEESY